MSLIRFTLIAFVLPEKGNIRYLKRLVSPTSRELWRHKEKLRLRSSFIDWIYGSELFAFKKRVKGDFDINTLNKAFTNRSYILKERQRDLGVENADINMTDNTKLTANERQVVQQYVWAYIIWLKFL